MTDAVLNEMTKATGYNVRIGNDGREILDNMNEWT